MCWHPMTKYGNDCGITRDASIATQNGQGASIAVGTLALLAPIWVQHPVSKDGGPIAIGGGKLSRKTAIPQEEEGMHPIAAH